MTTQPIGRPIQRVPHLRDGLIVDKPGSQPACWWGGMVGIARTRNRLPLPGPEFPGTSR